MLTNSNPVQNLRFDGYVARLSSTGSWVFATPASNASPTALVLSGGQLVVTGNLSAPATFGYLTIVPNAVPAAFVASLGGGALAAVAAATSSPACVAVPNPTSGHTVLTLPAAARARPVLLLDALGREVRRFELSAQLTSLPLNLTGLPGGSYLLRCGTSAGRLLVE